MCAKSTEALQIKLDFFFMKLKKRIRTPVDIVLSYIDKCFMTYCISGDEQEERSFHRYKRRSDAGGSGFNSADDVYQFNATRTIFVGNIERNTNSTELKRMFERYGEIVVGHSLRISEN